MIYMNHDWAKLLLVTYPVSPDVADHVQEGFCCGALIYSPARMKRILPGGDGDEQAQSRYHVYLQTQVLSLSISFSPILAVMAQSHQR